MQKFNNSLPGRILTVLLATLSASGLIYLVLIFNRGIIPQVLHWTLLCALGVSAGIAARILLPGRIFLLQWLSALLGLLAGLVLLGFLSQGVFGAQLPVSNQNRLNLGWLAQFILTSTASLIALKSWKIPRHSRSGEDRPVRISESAAAPQPSSDQRNQSKIGKTARRLRKTTSRPSKLTTSRLIQPKFWQKRWGKLQQDLRRWWEHGIPDPRILNSESPKRKSRKPGIRLQVKSQIRRARPQRRHRTNVRLVGREEHRCPYCLEEVQRSDPRGVKICSICHTYHHADCWAVTGTCQVPHYHEQLP